jgi:dTDP-4-amino-4,6-dideoxygalactose transaminase
MPCDVERLQAIADKHGLKVVYDGAHAFDVRYKDRPILSFGDVTTLSFHATKLFHTVEGGAVASPHDAVHERMKLMRSFGHVNDDHFLPGVNAKNSELHAAVGIVNLRHFEAVRERRKEQWRLYHELLHEDGPRLLRIPDHVDFNHAYFPVVLRSEEVLHHTLEELKARDVFPRRYFHPSLTELPYLDTKGSCPRAADVADRVLCLPLFHDLSADDQRNIAAVVRTCHEGVRVG